MDTMKVLLGATIALLLGAVALSWHGMKEGETTTSSDEISRLKKQMDDIRREQDSLKLERQRQQLRDVQPAAPTPAPISDTEREALKAELAAKEAALQEIQAQKDKAERKAANFRDEAGEIAKHDLEKSDNELRRARMIGEALVMGKITQYASDPNVGDIIIFQVMMPDNVQVGSVLGIRRKTGMIGQIKVTEITPEGAIASPLTAFGEIKPSVGDDLILPPQY